MPKQVKAASKLSEKKPMQRKSSEPLWKGPQDPGPLGGVTQSMIKSIFDCKERARIQYILGLSTPSDFSPSLEYGSMWHKCEEAFAASGNPIVNNPVADAPWIKALKGYCVGLADEYPMREEVINHWYNVCKTQFPIYINWWKKHPDIKGRKPLLQETVFHVPYKLPSGRVVYLKGRWDSVDLVKGQIWLMENKTKSSIDVIKLQRELKFEIQTMTYLVALLEEMTGIGDGTRKEAFGPEEFNDCPLAGVRYNVIKRPLSGGQGSIRKLQPTKSNPKGESDSEFYERLRGVIEESVDDRGEHSFFCRFNVEVSNEDIEAFKQKFLNPFLEHICDWYDYVTSSFNSNGDPFASAANHVHWMHPYGMFSAVDEGYAEEYDEFISTGNKVGLVKKHELLGELQ